MSSLYKVQSVSPGNEGLFATMDIQPMDLILTEIPFLWSALPARPRDVGDLCEVFQFCSHCGASILRLELLLYFLYLNWDYNPLFLLLPPFSANDLLLFYAKKMKPHSAEVSQAEFSPVSSCPCGALYCNEDCRNAELARGHSIICESPHFPLQSSLDQNGHGSLAVKAFCLLLKTCIDKNIKVKEAFELLFGGFFQERMTRTHHALRSGSILLPDAALFDEIVAPIYVATKLQPLLDNLVVIFGSPEYDRYHIREALSTTFLDRLIGTFVVNNVSFEMASPLEGLIASQETSVEFASSLHDGLLELREGCASALLGVPCTAICPLLAKTNHSCEPNTYVSYGHNNRAEISIHAASFIPSGGEIFHSYLHTPSSGAARMLTKSERRRALCQYLFECKCGLCNSEPTDSDENNYWQ